MVRIFDINECKGFIKDIFLKVQNSCSVEQMNDFSKLDNDIERFCFASKIDNLKNYEVKRKQFTMKSIRVAQNFKQKGNNAFQHQKWSIALDLYNKSLIMIPADGKKKKEFLQ